MAGAKKNVAKGKDKPGSSPSGKRLEIPKKQPALYLWLAGFAVALVTAFVFSGVTSLDWTNWDDDEYVSENEIVTKGETKRMFDTPVNNTYVPLVQLSFSIEWKNARIQPGKDPDRDPWLFHFTNLCLHVFCTFLVYKLMLLLGLNLTWAAIAALMFGLHPLKVESVAWITERKDVLFGVFFIGGLVAYLNYLKSEKIILLVFTFILFGLSLLSKIQATTFPLTLLAIDWYKRRKLNGKLIAEKIPFFAGAIAIGIWGVIILSKGNSFNSEQDFSIDNVFLGMYTFCVYLIKLVIPYEVCAYYPTPSPLHVVHYMGLIGVPAIGVAMWLLRKQSRVFIFGMMFFIFNIMFLLQILSAGIAFKADRFTFIAYIGLFFTIAMLLQELTEKRKNLKPVAIGISLVWCGIFGALSAKYIQVWKNSGTLWNDVIAKYPDKLPLAYNQRGHYLRREGRNEEAFRDFNTAIRLKADNYLFYMNRGNIYFDRGEDDKAIADYTKSIELLDTTENAGSYTNRGAIYSRKGMYKEALADFDKSMKLNPKDKNLYRNRGLTYYNLGENEKNIQDYITFLKYEPNDPNITHDIGIAYQKIKKYDEAIIYLTKAIKLLPKNSAFIRDRSSAYYQKGNYKAAYADALEAKRLGGQVNENLLKDLEQYASGTKVPPEIR